MLEYYLNKIHGCYYQNVTYSHSQSASHMTVYSECIWKIVVKIVQGLLIHHITHHENVPNNNLDYAELRELT